jgi:Kef-type K+ transport system membrane component KefB
MRLLLILVLGSLMHAVGSFGPKPDFVGGTSGTALAIGYLLLSAFFAGSIFKSIGLPKLTGYIITGIIVGPKVLGLVSDPVVANLTIFNGVAVALIALTGGVELDLTMTRSLMRTIRWLILLAIFGTTILLSVTAYVVRGMLPFMRELTTVQALAVATVLGITAVAQSPAVVVALRSEMEADGPLSRTVLGVVVISDLIIILMFAAASSLAKTTFGTNVEATQTASTLTWELLGSMLCGVVVGIVLAAYIRYVKGSGGLFVAAVAFVVAEVGLRIDFDPLIVALAAGMFVRNLTKAGDRLREEIEKVSLPVYVGFFAVTGSTIHIEQLLIVGVPALIFVGVRASGFLAGSWIAATIADAPETVRKYAGFGLLPQAGLALALALLFVRIFPQFGAGASALVLSIVAINEIVAPALYRFALVRSGEAKQAKAPEEEMPAVEAYEELG